jgi:hypothetical protein
MTTEKIPSIEEICQQRLTCIKELEEEFANNPSQNTAMVLRDLWKNWDEEKWEDYIAESPKRDEVLMKIASYSVYAAN